MDHLIKDIREIFDSDDNINTETVRNLFENYKSNPADWSKYAHFDPHKFVFLILNIFDLKKLNVLFRYT